MAPNSGPGRGRSMPATESGPSVAEQNPPTADTDPLHGWNDYPICLPSPHSWSQIGVEVSRRLKEDERLFSKPSDASIEVCDVPRSPNANLPIKPQKVSQGELRKVLMDGSGSYWRSFTITQKNSWSRLSVTEEMLRKLLTFYQVSPAFLNIVHFFGIQTRDRMLSSAGFRSVVRSKPTNPRAYVSEVCFRLMHVEKHGRSDTDHKTPWSVRQMGCYQKFDYGDSSAVCIHIQPPKDKQTRLTEALERGDFNKKPGRPDPMSLHLDFLAIAMQNWDAYVSDLDEELVKRREYVLLSEKRWEQSRKGGSDYERCLNLQLFFRNTLLRTLLALDTNLDVIKGLQSHIKKLRTLHLIPDYRGTHEASDILEQSEALLRDLRRDTATILQAAEGVAQLMKTVLDSRNDTLIENHTTAVQELVKMANESTEINSKMVDFAERTKQDSRTMRVATMLATLYLPSTFVATVFGMDLFHSDPIEEGGKTGYTFNVAAQIWIFAIIAMGLTGITVTSFLLWGRKLRQKENIKIDQRRNSMKVEDAV